MQTAGDVIARGQLPDGQEWRLWRCRATGKRIVYVGHSKGGRGKRRNPKWLKKTLREAGIPLAPVPEQGDR